MPDPQRIIVLGEDDEGHATLILRNLQRGGLASGVLHLRDGQAVLDAFRRKPGEVGPIAVLLDIHMPGVDGIAVLRELKRDPVTAKVPVVMLTTTDDSHEVERCYGLGAAAYIAKPIEYGQFSDVIQRLAAFLNIVHLPEGEVWR
jgi:CheY-like chemotaxis protein